MQVVSNTYATQTNVASTTYTDTGLSATITPSAASSKILVLISQHIWSDRFAVGSYIGWQLLRDATVVYLPNTTKQAKGMAIGGATYVTDFSVIGVSYLDSPSTTSAITYKSQIAAESTSNSGVVRAQEGGGTSSIILMEIGA